MIYPISGARGFSLRLSLVRVFETVGVALVGPLNVCFCHKAVLGQKALHSDFGTLSILMLAIPCRFGCTCSADIRIRENLDGRIPLQKAENVKGGLCSSHPKSAASADRHTCLPWFMRIFEDSRMVLERKR